jgi:urease accessory protein
MSHGAGLLEFRRVGSRTVLTRSRASHPLTLLSPRRRGESAWAVCGSLGGGLVAGDRVKLDVTVGAGASGMIGTQASTKVFRSPENVACCQELNAVMEAGGVLVVVPDPLTCFAGAVYEQRQRFELHESASLVVVDWLTSGRRARGERWAFTRCQLLTEIFMGGRQIFRDAIRLDAADGPLEHPSRMGKCDCWATVVLVGPRVVVAATELLEYVGRQPVAADAPIFLSAGPITGGALLRAASSSAESMLRFFREHLGFLAGLCGDDPWGRKG